MIFPLTQRNRHKKLVDVKFYGESRHKGFKPVSAGLGDPPLEKFVTISSRLYFGFFTLIHDSGSVAGLYGASFHLATIPVDEVYR